MHSSTDSLVPGSIEEWRACFSLASLSQVMGLATWSALLLVGGLLWAGCDSNGSAQEPPVTRDATVRLSVEEDSPTARDSIKFIYSIYVSEDSTGTATLDFGDGTEIEVEEGDYQNTYHAYSNDGTYTATLTTKDGSGSEMKESVELTVRPEEPEASITSSTDNAEAGQEVTFTYSISDPDDVIETAVLEFGDGESVPVQAGEDQTETHVYDTDAIGEVEPRIVINGDVKAFTSLVVFSNEIIEVEAGTGNINKALQEAKQGVTIRLITDGGIYVEDGLGISTDNLTIEAEEGLSEPPVVVYDENEFNNEFTFVRLANPASRLTLKNFIIGRPAGNTTAQPKNLITHAADESRLDLFIHGMELRNVSNKIINNQNDSDPAVYDSLVVTQSYLHSSGNNVIDLKATNTADNATLTANYVELENVTIAKTTDMSRAVGVITKGGKNSSDTMVLRVNHVTVDQTKLGFNINRTPVDCSLSDISNTVITRTQGGSTPAIRWNGLCQIEVSHMVTYQTSGFGGGNISSSNSFEWEELHYRDAPGGDYGLQDGAPGTASNMPASDGDDRGDLSGYDDNARVSSSNWMIF